MGILEFEGRKGKFGSDVEEKEKGEGNLGGFRPSGAAFWDRDVVVKKGGEMQG